MICGAMDAWCDDVDNLVVDHGGYATSILVEKLATVSFHA
jgi:hypothetical protein